MNGLKGWKDMGEEQVQIIGSHPVSGSPSGRDAEFSYLAHEAAARSIDNGPHRTPGRERMQEWRAIEDKRRMGFSLFFFFKLNVVFGPIFFFSPSTFQI